MMYYHVGDDVMATIYSDFWNWKESVRGAKIEGDCSLGLQFSVAFLLLIIFVRTFMEAYFTYQHSYV